jgi:transcriptional regulator with XRE-family HTH domain
LISKAWDFQPTTIGEHIKRRRLEMGLYQKDVAKLLGVTEYTIINWEKGRTEPTVSNIPSLVRFLGYDPAPPEPATSIAERLRAKRREMGLGQREVARILGVDASTVMRWERGRRIQELEHRRLVATFLGVDTKLFSNRKC